MLRTLTTIHPMRDLKTVEEMLDQMFGNNSKPKRPTHTLAVDVVERGESFVVTAAVPGVSPKDLQVNIEENVLTIRGESVSGRPTEGDKVYLSELTFGEFNRSLRLPEGLDIEAVSANFENGIVTITLPKLPVQKPQVIRVPIQTNAEIESHEETSQE